MPLVIPTLLAMSARRPRPLCKEDVRCRRAVAADQTSNSCVVPPHPQLAHGHPTPAGLVGSPTAPREIACVGPRSASATSPLHATQSCAPPLCGLSPHTLCCLLQCARVQVVYGPDFGRAGRLPVLTALRSHDCCLLTLALVRGVRSSSPSSWCCYLPAAPLPCLRSTRRGPAGSTPCDRLWCGRTCSQPEMDCLT